MALAEMDGVGIGVSFGRAFGARSLYEMRVWRDGGCEGAGISRLSCTGGVVDWGFVKWRRGLVRA